MAPPNEALKGIKGLYEECCEGRFYQWIFPTKDEPPPPVAEKHICLAPVWYHDHEAFTMIEDRYDPFDEFNSTWKLQHFSAAAESRIRLSHRPYKVFELESDDDLVVLKCKVRPVLVIKKVSCDWRVPDNAGRIFNSWLCLPLFSYKRRHDQRYVFIDQALERPHQFYFPPGTPGLDNECAGRILNMRFIPEQNLSPFKKMCYDRQPQMRRPFGLSEQAFHAVLGHVAKTIPDIDLSGKANEWYEFFEEFIREEIKNYYTKKI